MNDVRKKPAPPADTDLVRLIWIQFTDKAPENSFTILWDGVSVDSLATRDSSMLVAASIPLAYFPKIDDDGLVIVPRKEREAVDQKLDATANLLAVAQHCGTTISACGYRSVFFHPKSQRARDWLESAQGVRVEGRAEALDMWARIDLSSVTVEDLASRADGLMLLAEALASNHATGAFHEYVRLFERAFARPASLLTDLVLATLDADLEYDRGEVANWFEQLRDPAAHADQRTMIVTAADVVAILPRMKQAAYDILLNKKDWRSTTTDRRDCWKLRAGTRKDTVFVVKGEAPVTSMTLLDEVGIYPLNLGPDIRSAPRIEWWPTAGAMPQTAELRTQ